MRNTNLKSILITAVLTITLFTAQGCGLAFLEGEDVSSPENTEAASSEIQETAEAAESGETADTESAAEAAASAENGESGANAESDSGSAADVVGDTVSEENAAESEESELPVITPEVLVQKEDEEIAFDTSWEYAEFSKINSGKAMLYYASSDIAKDITVCINAGHGTKGGSSVKTQCHPDGTPKVTGGTTSAGETHAVAVSTGMDFADGTPERIANLALSLIVKDKLLAKGYNVLMTRIDDDVQLDNIARTLIANHYADCHIAIHYDSTSSDKGAYYMSVPDVASYRAMEPVASHWEEHNRLGDSVIEGLTAAGAKVMSGGSIEMDLTQTSYSTVPSIDLECGDKVSDRSEETLNTLAEGIAKGIDIFFAQGADSASSSEDTDASSSGTDEISGEKADASASETDGFSHENADGSSAEGTEASDEDAGSSDGVAE